MSRRDSAKLRPAWLAGREASAEEVAVIERFPQPLSAALLAGFPLLRARRGLEPWRPRHFLDDVLDSGYTAVVCLAFVLRFGSEPDAWSRAAAHWPYEMRRALLSTPASFEVAPLWKADSLHPTRRLEDLHATWLAQMGAPPRVSSGAAARLWLDRSRILPPELLMRARRLR